MIEPARVMLLALTSIIMSSMAVAIVRWATGEPIIVRIRGGFPSAPNPPESGIETATGQRPQDSSASDVEVPSGKGSERNYYFDDQSVRRTNRGDAPSVKRSELISAIASASRKSNLSDAGAWFIVLFSGLLWYLTVIYAPSAIVPNVGLETGQELNEIPVEWGWISIVVVSCAALTIGWAPIIRREGEDAFLMIYFLAAIIFGARLLHKELLDRIGIFQPGRVEAWIESSHINPQLLALMFVGPAFLIVYGVTTYFENAVRRRIYISFFRSIRTPIFSLITLAVGAGAIAALIVGGPRGAQFVYAIIPIVIYILRSFIAVFGAIAFSTITVMFVPFFIEILKSSHWFGAQYIFRVPRFILGIMDWFFAVPVAALAGVHSDALLLRYVFLFAWMAGAAWIGWNAPTPINFIAIGFGFAVVASVVRRWSWVEDDRAQFIVQGGTDLENQRAGFRQDLRDEALTAIVLSFLLVPVALSQLDREFHWFSVSQSDSPGYVDWLGYFGAELAKAAPLFDWSEVFHVANGSPIAPRTPAGAACVFLMRIGLDIFIISAVLQALQIMNRIGDQSRAFDSKRLKLLDPFEERYRLRTLARPYPFPSQKHSWNLSKFPEYKSERLRALLRENDGTPSSRDALAKAGAIYVLHKYWPIGLQDELLQKIDDRSEPERIAIWETLGSMKWLGAVRILSKNFMGRGAIDFDNPTIATALCKLASDEQLLAEIVDSGFIDKLERALHQSIQGSIDYNIVLAYSESLCRVAPKQRSPGTLLSALNRCRNSYAEPLLALCLSRLGDSSWVAQVRTNPLSAILARRPWDDHLCVICHALARIGRFDKVDQLNYFGIFDAWRSREKRIPRDLARSCEKPDWELLHDCAISGSKNVKIFVAYAISVSGRSDPIKAERILQALRSDAEHDWQLEWELNVAERALNVRHRQVA